MPSPPPSNESVKQESSRGIMKKINPLSLPPSLLVQ